MWTKVKNEEPADNQDVCEWCKGPLPELRRYTGERLIQVWFQDWTEGGHRIERVTDRFEALFFCTVPCRHHYFFGM